jgi:AcrR family transcriptional regulator
VGNEICSDFSRKNLKVQRTDRAVLTAAQLFLERGIEEIKMTDIADASGVGVATLYRYFGTKPRMVTEVMTYLWDEVNELFAGIFDTREFMQQEGIKQISDLMRMYLVLYEAHSDFMRLLGEFDTYIIREQIAKEDLIKYESSIINFYPVLVRAYEKGLKDGSVRRVDNFKMYYLTYAHALLEMCKKFVKGEILPSDRNEYAVTELELLIESGVSFFSTR